MKQYIRQLQHTSFGRPQRSQHDVYVRMSQRRTVPVVGVENVGTSRQTRRPLMRIASLVRLSGLTVLLLAVAGLSLGDTLSFYYDVERSTGNTLATGGVDFILTDTPFADLASTTDWEVDVIPEDFSNPFFYTASSSNFSGNLDLCRDLIVTVYQNNVIMYHGLLTELRTATTTDLSTWVYDFDNFENYAGETCHFDVVYDGWQTRHDYNPGGYSDVEVVSFWITVPSLLLTKVYFDYDAGETCYDETATTTITNGSIQFKIVNSDLPQCGDVSHTQEWVEIYNLSSEPIDVTGWEICDGDTCDMLVADNPIEPGAFGLIAGLDSIHTEISIPWGVELMLIPDGQIGNGVRTKGDMLQLRNPSGMTIDQLNWGDVNPFWPHYTPTLWPSGALTATSGAALARLPIDVDTNSPDNWQLLGIPAVVLLNPSSTTISVTPGELVDIEWTAHNLNGPDEDLKIDIYWFDPEDGLHLIVLDTDNDGLYQWLVPEGLSGDVRIKLVATGPENPLLNTRILTDRIPVSQTRLASFAALTLFDEEESKDEATGGGGESLPGEFGTTTDDQPNTNASSSSTTTVPTSVSTSSEKNVELIEPIDASAATSSESKNKETTSPEIIPASLIESEETSEPEVEENPEPPVSDEPPKEPEPPAL